MDSLSESAKKHGEQAGLSGCKMHATKAAEADQKVAQVLSELKSMAESSGQTLVVHLVVEGEATTSRRRRLEENRQGENGDQQQQEGNQFGYGYFDQNGNWVTPYKSMFQIQLFNVVLWTSIGLVVLIFFVIYLMMNMPLEPDTLLFGESAKLPGDD